MGIDYWWSMALLLGLCAAYTSLGGFAAVIRTDVLFMGIIFSFFVALVVTGTKEVGSMAEIWKRNDHGNRTVMFRMSPDNETNYSFWSLSLGGFFLSLSSSLNQSLLQRLNANKTVQGAQMTYICSQIAVGIAQAGLIWVGMVSYARYQNCDPVKSGRIKSRDQITILFATELFNNREGLMGLFLAGILAASLSTISSAINSFSTVVIIDFVNLFFPKLKFVPTMLLTKISGIIYGALIVAATLLVDQFGGIRQVGFVIRGSSFGPISGVFMLGFFFPWATTKGAFSGFICSLAFIWWVAIGRLVSRVPYYTLPVSTEGCSDPGGFFRNQTLLNNVSETVAGNATTMTSQLLGSLKPASNVNMGVEQVFFLYRLNSMCYCMVTMIIVIIVGISVSLLTGPRDPELVNPRLISPLSWFVLCRLPARWRRRLGFRSDRFLLVSRVSTILETPKGCLGESEMESLKHQPITEDKCNDGIAFETSLVKISNNKN